MSSITNQIFQDLPLLDKSLRLTVMELRHSEKQIVNELIYRWCRVITRAPRGSSEPRHRILIIDMTGSVNPIRLATVMKRDEHRMSMVALVRGCKINSTYVTIKSYLGNNAPNPFKLVVIYQDEFLILKTLSLLKESLRLYSSCQFVLVVPRLDRQEHDVLNLTSNYQVLRADFCVNRREIKPAPPEQISETYQEYLNEVCFNRWPSIKTLPDRVNARLIEDGLYLVHLKTKDMLDEGKPVKKARLAASDTASDTASAGNYNKNATLQSNHQTEQ